MSSCPSTARSSVRRAPTCTWTGRRRRPRRPRARRRVAVPHLRQCVVPLREVDAGVGVEGLDVLGELVDHEVLGLVEVLLALGVPVDAVGPEVHPGLVGGRVEHGHVAARRAHRRVDEVLPGLDGGRDDGVVVDPSGRAPVLRHAVLVPGVEGLIRVERVDVLEVRELGQVELFEQTLLHHLGDVRRRSGPPRRSRRSPWRRRASGWPPRSSRRCRW